MRVPGLQVGRRCMEGGHGGPGRGSQACLLMRVPLVPWAPAFLTGGGLSLAGSGQCSQTLRRGIS